MAQFISAVTIELETFPPYAAVFRIIADDFDDALETAEVGHTFNMQADQQFMVREFIAALIQYNRHLSGFGRIAMTVRDKSLSLIHISEPTRRTPISYAV